MRLLECCGFRAFFDDGYVPGGERDVGVLGYVLAGEEIGAAEIGIVEAGLLARVIEVVMNALAFAVDSLLCVDGGGKLLVGAGEAGLLERLAEHGSL